MNKHTIGQKLKISYNVDVEIINSGQSKLGDVEHYGVVYFIREVGQDTKSNAGWIPVAVLDAMDAIVL